MVARLWHGWTSKANAPVYEELLRNEVFPSIEKKNVKGYRKISLLKRVHKDEVEFITIMLFDSIEAIKEFTGDDYEKSYVPQKARDVLSKQDESSQHYEIINEIEYL
ncbi:MAG: antibiotic biosynthesis monooxygenase [Bacteroidetes bacterium]|nr:antibiotic biosynthesis monooxygenase [Bacteroidota bacterium]